MIRFFEKDDKSAIIKLAIELHGENFKQENFKNNFDNIINGNEHAKGIVALHDGQYLGYAIIFINDKETTVDEIYIRNDFQKKGVSPQIFDFMENNLKSNNYSAYCPENNEIAKKVFKRRKYALKKEKIMK